MSRSEVATPNKKINMIIVKGYFNDVEYDAIVRYARLLPESNEPYIFERSTKMYNIIIINGKEYKNAEIILA